MHVWRQQKQKPLQQTRSSASVNIADKFLATARATQKGASRHPCNVHPAVKRRRPTMTDSVVVTRDELTPLVRSVHENTFWIKNAIEVYEGVAEHANELKLWSFLRVGAKVFTGLRYRGDLQIIRHGQ
jgi:hypothetical protein